MSYPNVVASQGYVQGTAATSWQIFTGTSCNQGSVVLVAARQFGTLSTASTNWTKLGETDEFAVFYKTADGSGEFTVSSTASTRYAAILFRVSNSGNVSGTATSNNDPPSHNALALRNHLWIAAVCADGDDIASAAPTTYTGLVTAQAASNTPADVSLSAAYRFATKQTENPGSFSSLTGTTAWTLALYNSGAVRRAGGRSAQII